MWGPYGKAKGKGYGYGAFGGGGLGGFGKGGGYSSPYASAYSKLSAMLGGGDGGWGGEEESSGGSKKKKSGGDKGWTSEVPGFKEALAEAFEAAGVTSDLEDIEELCKKCESSAQKQAKKFFNDERSGQKMNSFQCAAFLSEFVEGVMSALSNFLYDKVWFEKVSWNGALLMLVINTFNNGKIFTRVVKTDIMPLIDNGLLTWSEEDRINKQFWKALEAAGMNDSSKKKATGHLQKAYDDAHWEAPFGTDESASLTPEVVMLQEFIKGWMTGFASKAYSQLESGTGDGSPSGQVAALTEIFQTLMDPDSPCLPLSLQPSVQPSPWPFIETCAQEVISAQSK